MYVCMDGWMDGWMI